MHVSELTTTIGSVLRQKDGEIFSITPDASVYHAIEIMAEKGVGALLVMEQGVLLGIVSERDYARKVILKGHLSRETTVAEIMSSPVIFVGPEYTVAECMKIVTEHRIRHLPVMRAGLLCGMISIGDLVNAILSEQSETIRHLEAYITGAG